MHVRKREAVIRRRKIFHWHTRGTSATTLGPFLHRPQGSRLREAANLGEVRRTRRRTVQSEEVGWCAFRRKQVFQSVDWHW